MSIAFVFQIIVGLLGLSFLVFIHEMGHFLIAKKAGVKVKTFSIGFGPKLIKKTWGETQYCISAIPFGGYVAMDGESPDDEGEDPKRAFRNQSIPVRAAIALGGPVINLVFAFLALWVLYMVGVQEKNQDLVVIGQIDKESAAATAGLLPKDTIISWDGQKAEKNNGWEKFNEYVAMRIDQPIRLEVGRENGRKIIGITPSEFRNFGIGYAGVFPAGKVVVPVAPKPGTPAAAAGAQLGDTLVSIMGHKIASAQDLIAVVQASQGQELTLTVLRAGQSLDLKVTPKYDAAEKRYLMGLQLGLIDPNPPVYVKRSVIDAAQKSLEKGWDMICAPFNYIARMIDGGVKVKSMSGPVGIVQMIGLTWEESLSKAIWLLAFISMNLGVMNLLPLAITDGGILMFLLLEAIRGKPLSLEVQGRIQQMAFFVFLSLFLYITFQDVSRFSLFMPK